jgi:hypothetical protein
LVETHDLVASLHRLASTAPADEAPTLTAAATEIVQLRPSTARSPRCVVPDLRRIIGVMFADHPEAPAQFHELRRVRT